MILRATLRDGDQDDGLVADCELIGRRTLAGQGEQETRHFTGQVRLGRRVPASPKAPVPAMPDGADGGVERPDVYSVYFHGPAYQVLDRAWREDDEIVGLLAGELPDDHDPMDSPMTLVAAADRAVLPDGRGVGARHDWPDGVADPRRPRDAVPQTASARGVCGRSSFRVTGGVDAQIVDDGGRVWLRLEGYRTSQVPGDLPAEALAPIRSA